MSKVRKTIFSFAIAACLLGLGLILAGLASGGLQDLVRSSAANTKMAKQEETYDNIHSLNLELSNRSVVIGESPDDKVHLTYYQGDGKTTEKISTKAENGSLYIKESSFFIAILKDWSSASVLSSLVRSKSLNTFCVGRCWLIKPSFIS